MNGKLKQTQWQHQYATKIFNYTALAHWPRRNKMWLSILRLDNDQTHKIIWTKRYKIWTTYIHMCIEPTTYYLIIFHGTVTTGVVCKQETLTLFVQRSTYPTIIEFRGLQLFWWELALFCLTTLVCLRV